VRSPDGGQFRLDRGGRRCLILHLVERDAGRVVLLSDATGRRNDVTKR
jgi:hypothetical protein